MNSIRKIKNSSYYTTLQILQLPEHDILYILLRYSGMKKTDAKETTQLLMHQYCNLSNILSIPTEELYHHTENPKVALILSVTFACIRKIFWENLII